MILRASEQRVLRHDPGSNGERLLRHSEAAALVNSGYYGASSGSPTGAAHWRRHLPDGSCLHLVIESTRRRLHHDSYDPRANLLSLTMHMTHEARPEAFSLAALSWWVVKLLAPPR